MTVLKGKYKNINNNSKITICIGNFDGIHLGHQKLIKIIKSYKDSDPSIMTFHPHPKAFFNNEDFKYLSSQKDNEKILSEQGIHNFFIINFDNEFSKLSVNEFISFLKSLNVVRVVSGKDTKFGYRASGKLSDLKEHFEIIEVEDYKEKYGKVSSTLIRKELANGNVKKVSNLLGRNYSIEGIVEHGLKIGKKIGYKTANIDYGNYKIPKNGVYYVKVFYNKEFYDGMCNVGYNPTINSNNKIKLEVNIFDFNKDIYNQSIRIYFIEHIRDEHKFKNLEELKEQLNHDKKTIIDRYIDMV